MAGTGKIFLRRDEFESFTMRLEKRLQSLRMLALGGGETSSSTAGEALILDQTTPQTVVNGIPLLDQEYDDFSNPDEFVNKGYVDWVATAIGANYYMTDDDDGDTGYKVCSLIPSADSETYIEASGVTDGQLLGTWISDVGEAPSKLPRGMYDWFIFAEKTSGTKTLRLYWKLYERKTDDSEVLIATSSESNELKMGEKTSYIIPLALDSDHTPDSGSRIVGKIYASVSGSGNAPTVKIYYQGASGSRWEIPTSTEILNNIYVKQADHTKAVHDALGIDAETTDGYHLDQDVRTTASPTFNDLTLSSPSNIYNLSHDSFTDFVANEHIDHTSVTLIAGTGLTGGGDISANRTFNVDVGIADNKILQVDQAAGLTAGNLVRATSSGLESRTDAEILAQLSGKAGSAFDWNGQDLTNVGDLDVSGDVSLGLTTSLDRRLTDIYIPRRYDITHIIMLDYQDEFANLVEKGASVSISPAQDSGSTSYIFHDTSDWIQWNSGTDTTGGIVIEIDTSGSPITHKASAYFRLALTFRWATSQYPTHIKIEDWDNDEGSYATVFDQDVTITDHVFLGPLFQATSSSCCIYKLRITLTVPNPLTYHLRLQRVILYHQTASWDPWHIHKRGDEMYGNLDVQAELRCDSFRIDQTPTAGTFTPDKYIVISCDGTDYKIPVKAV